MLAHERELGWWYAVGMSTRWTWRMGLVAAGVVGVVGSAAWIGGSNPRGTVASDDALVEAAKAFVASLRAELRERCVMAFESPERETWLFVPGRRAGVTIKEMNAQERRAAHAMLRAALSAHGYLKTTAIMELDDVLRELGGGASRDPELYYFAMFGEPSRDRPWGWRVEGHHVSLHFSSVDGEVVSVTPAFLGANPAEVQDGRRAGLRVLAREEDLGFALLESLTAEQRRVCVFSERSPRDIVLSPRVGFETLGDTVGVRASELGVEQLGLLRLLLAEYTGNYASNTAERMSERMYEGGLEGIRFAWAGSGRRGDPWYYRITGETFIIEACNFQDGANHVHTVWHDLRNDFGREVLARHVREGH